jgi:hypothetical protein
VRVDALDRDQAREAIEKPLAQYNVLKHDDITIEVSLVDAVIHELSSGSAAPGMLDYSPVLRVEAPLLQVVMNRIWHEAMRTGSTTLHAETLAALGGAQRIFGRSLEEALETLSGGERELAATALRFLVTPTGTKIALAAADLADFCGVPLAELEPILEKLAASNCRILRPVHAAARDDPTRFEIFHDVLAQPILEWSRRHPSESRIAVLEGALRAARWRLTLALAGLVVLLAALLVVALR